MVNDHQSFFFIDIQPKSVPATGYRIEKKPDIRCNPRKLSDISIHILVKVSVRDRTLVTTRDAERQVITPVGLQERINQVVSKYNR